MLQGLNRECSSDQIIYPKLMKRRAPKKSLYTRKFKKSRGIISIPRNIISPPRLQFLWTTLTYSDHQFVLNPGALGTAAVRVFAANGLYDVDTTGVGHQPTGFDQLMAMFSEYCVVQADIEATFVNYSTVHQAIVGVSFQDQSTTSTDDRQYVENGNCVSKVIGTSGGASPDITTLRMMVPIQKFTTKQNILDENGFSGTVSTNPADTQYFHCFATPMDETADMGTLGLRVVITFKALFREPSLTNLS